MKISIITPSFQQGEFIQQTIDSVLKQGYALKELVVFDGGSTDNTVSVLQGYGNAFAWVSERDGGQSHAINKGIRASSGEIIGWLNSDDFYYPQALDHVAKAFRENPMIDVIYGEADHVDISGQKIETYPVEDWNFERMKQTCIICQPACFFRRRVVEHYGLLDEKLDWCMDYEFWLRLAKKGVKFLKIPQRIAASRMYADNKTLRARVKVHEEINHVMKNHFKKVPDRWIFNLAHYIAEEKIAREKNEKEFCRTVGFHALKGFWLWRTIPKVSSLKCIIKNILL